jgi:hypothetical protein
MNWDIPPIQDQNQPLQRQIGRSRITAIYGLWDYLEVTKYNGETIIHRIIRGIIVFFTDKEVRNECIQYWIQ